VLDAEVVVQSLGKMIRAAREDGVSGEAAGTKEGISEVADELAWVMTLETHGRVDCGFN